MSNLYNNLPPESLKEIYKTQIQPGAVFFLYDEIARKEKFIVILGIACPFTVPPWRSITLRGI